LVSIQTEEEHQYLFERFYDHADGPFWIGGIRDGDVSFIWSDGKPFDYVNWKAGDPNNWGGNEGCIELGLIPPNEGKWNDRNCDTNLVFVCKLRSDCHGKFCPKICPNYNIQCSNATKWQVGPVTPVTTTSQCGVECQNTNGCNAWTMIPKNPTPPNATCYFLSNCEQREDIGGRISGYRTCPKTPGGTLSDCPVADTSCIARDNVVAPTITVTTFDKCGEACANTKHCNYWTMDPEFLPPADCYVLSTCDGAFAKNGSVSGSKGCPAS